MEALTRPVAHELMEGEQADLLGGRGRYQRRGGCGWARATAINPDGSGPYRARTRGGATRTRGRGTVSVADLPNRGLGDR